MPTDEFDGNLLHFNADLFAPMLKEDLHEQPPPFLTTHPLTEVDFSTHSDDNSFLNDLNDVLDAMHASFGNRKAALDRDQWIRAAAQLAAGINTGLCHSYLYNTSLYFLSDLGPSKCKGLESLTVALGSLNYFLTYPPSDDDAAWRQCAHCLAVGGTQIMADHLEALLLTCGQDTAATRQTILNTEIAEFRLKVIEWTSWITVKANDHAVLAVMGSDPPPFISDPHIVEWINRRADMLAGEAKHKALLTA